MPKVRIGKADKLSRRLNLKIGVENNDENQKLIKRGRGKDKEVMKVVEETRVKVLRGDKWEIKEELVLKKEKVYVLKDEKLRLEVIQIYHDIPVAGYKKQQS